MIEFDCEHCGKPLHLNDSYAGRDGWCRACKQMVIVPSGGRTYRVRDLPQEEGIQRLQRLLQYAATKADKFKLHLAQQEPEGRRVAGMEDALRQAYERVERQERAILDMREAEGTLRAKYDHLSTDTAARITWLESMLAEAASQSTGDSDWVAEKKILEADLQTALDGKLDLQRQLEEKSEAIVDLESRVADGVAHDATVEDWAAEKAALIQERDTAHREVETLHDQLTQQTSAVSALEVALADAEAQLAISAESEGPLATLEDELHEARAEAEALKSEVEEQKQRIATLEEAATTPAADHTDELDALGAECESLRAGLVREEQRVAAATADQTNLQAALATAEEAVAHKQAETEAALAQQKVLQTKLDNLSAEKQKECLLMVDQATRLRAQESEIGQYKSEIAAQTESLAELRSRHDERDRSMRDQIRALEDQVTLFDTLKDRMAGLQDRVSRLDQEHLDLTLTLEDAKRKLDVAEKKEGSLEERLEASAREKASFLVQIEDLQRDATCKTDQIAQLSEELKALSKVGTSADLDREKERRALQAAEDRVQSLQDELETLREEREALLRDMASGAAERDTAQANYEALEAQVGAADDSSTIHTAQLQAAEERVTVLEAALRESTDHLAQQEESAQNAVRDLAIARKTIDALEQELSEMESDVGDDGDDEEDSDRVFHSVDSDDSEPIVLTEIVSDRQRQKERQQMMDVLSDFLDK